MQSSPKNKWVEGDVSENKLEIDSNTPSAVGSNRSDLPEKTFEISYTVLLKDFASETSFGGISKVTLSDGKIKRFLWLLISVTCYVLTITYCISLVNNYLRKPIKTSIDISYEKNINFPSVTVCNLNQFRQSKLKEVKSIQDVLKGFSDENRNKSDGSILEDTLERLRQMQIKELAHDDEDLGDVDIDEDVLLEQYVAMLASDYNQTHLKQVGHQFHDMILSCSWKGADCREGYFAKLWAKHWNWRYGNCFTFNSGGNETGHSLSVIRTSRTGPHHGLTLDINIEQSSEYVEELTSEAGVLITIDKAEHMPFPYDKGITVSPGFSSSISLRQESITRVDPHNNHSCYSREELSAANIYRTFLGGSCTKYSVEACLQSCLAKAQHERCGCSYAKYAWFVARICHSFEELHCIHIVSSDFEKYKLGCDKKCPQPCKQYSFLANIMTATLTSKEKESRKKKSGFEDNNGTDFVFDDNILRVKIFYDEFNLESIVQSTYYDLESLIGDIGGQMGLWIGVSIISVAEFGELLINLCILAARKYRDKRKSKTTVIELQ